MAVDPDGGCKKQLTNEGSIAWLQNGEDGWSTCTWQTGLVSLLLSGPPSTSFTLGSSAVWSRDGINFFSAAGGSCHVQPSLFG
jgi:hypothetical protein